MKTSLCGNINYQHIRTWWGILHICFKVICTVRYHAIAPAPSKQPWTIWVNASLESSYTDIIRTTICSPTSCACLCDTLNVHTIRHYGRLAVLIMTHNDHNYHQHKTSSIMHMKRFHYLHMREDQVETEILMLLIDFEKHSFGLHKNSKNDNN